MMVHYSSYTVYYEGGAKNPLKGISLKFLANALNAQFCVFPGSKEFRVECNGIHLIPYFRGDLMFQVIKCNLCKVPRHEA